MKRLFASPAWIWVVVFLALFGLVAGNQQIQTVREDQTRLENTTRLTQRFSQLEQALWSLESAVTARELSADVEVSRRIASDVQQVRLALDEAKSWRSGNGDETEEGALGAAFQRLETAVAALERTPLMTVDEATALTRTALQEVRSVSSRLWQSYAAIAAQISNRWQHVGFLILLCCVLAAICAYTLRKFHRDLLEREDAEDALRESEERYRRLVEVCPDAILVHREGQILFVNRAGVELFGAASAAELVRTPLDEFCPLNSQWTSFGRDPGRGEFQLRRPDGTQFEAEVMAASFNFQDSAAVQMIIRDMSSLRFQQQQLEESERRFRSVFENVAEGVYQSTVDGKVIDANPALVAMLGYASLVQLQAADIAEDLYEDPAQRAEAQRQLAESGVLESRELRLRRRDGSVITLLENARAVRGLDGNIAYYEGTLTDISDLKNAGEALREARDEALRVSRMKSEFLANVSHEIRTPMNGILGMTELLAETPLNTEQQEYAEAVRRSAGYLLNIINDILDFSKIEAGRLEIETIDFDLREKVEDVVELLAEKAQEKGLELITRIDPQLPERFAGDPYRLQQVLTNLLGNAIKFTPAGSVTVRLQQDNGIRVEVEDTGIGVPEERRERLFLPFSQADGSTTRKYGGTGLGLAISRQLVELMGGEIGCEPGRDRGSLFYFQLPLEARSSARNWPARKQGDCLLVMKAGERRDSYQDLLCAMGFQVSVAGSISQTLEAAANHWKVILTDQHLPDGNAVELQQALDRLKVRTPESLVRLVPWRERPVERLNDEWFRATLPEPCRLHQLIEAMGVEPEGDALLPQLEQLNQALDERVQTTDLYPTVPRVLIAEDNAINQRVAARMLEHLGVEPVVVENGAQALEALGLERFAMVFMDCQMPEMDGFAATEAWRSKERLADWERVPIIAMTAHAMQGDRERCLAAGMDDYMTKPISRTGLEGMLSKWLWRGKAAHPSGDLISASAQRA